MPRSISVLSILGLLVGMINVSRAQTVSIAGLYQTGVTNTGVLLGNNQVDAHYVISAAGATYDGTSRTVSSIPAGWAPNSATARWVTTPWTFIGFPIDGLNTSRPAGIYDYSLTFTMPVGAQLATTSISGTGAADDSAEIYMNGVLVSGQTINAPGTTNGFTLSSANATFLAGSNTITFRVNNTGAGSSSTGLLISSLSGTVVVPEVGALLPVASALALLAIIRGVQRRSELL